MYQDKMYLVNKIFNNETIRTVWDTEQEKYFISVVDIVSVISESKDGRKYWNKLKQRLNSEGNETVTNCHQLKLKAKDGKYRMTDVVDIEGMFRIIESIPSKNAEPIKQWLAKLGSERIDESLIHLYQFKDQLIYIELKVMMKNGLQRELRVFRIEKVLLMYGKMVE